MGGRKVTLPSLSMTGKKKLCSQRVRKNNVKNLNEKIKLKTDDVNFGFTICDFTFVLVL